MRRVIVKIFLVIGLVLLPLGAGAKSWNFDRWVCDITINPDSTFVVRETQTVDFQGSFTWLRRDIALRRLKKISEIKVYNEEGRALTPGEFETSRGAGEVGVKINFEAQDEQKTWTIEYKVHGGIGFFEDYDELYWNAVSEERDVGIEEVEVLVHLPQEVDPSEIKQRLFIGATGSQDESSDFALQDSKTLRYWGKDIKPYENFTIVAGWPKGIVEKDWWLILSPYLWFLIPLFGLGFLFRRWWKKGRDPKAKGTVIAQYEPPKDLLPAEMGVLVYEKSRVKDFSATLVDLAYRGYLKIVEREEKGFLRKSKTYDFVKQRDFREDSKLRAHERLVLEGVFGEKQEVSLSQLENKFYRNIPDIKKAILDQVVKEQYFPKSPQNVKTVYFGWGIALLVLGGILGFVLTQFFAAVALGLTAIFTIIFGQVMPARTQKGADAKWHALGFREYLRVAERFRLKANVDPKTFEKYLSYAMVFGVERAWANRFADIYREPPDWYVPVHAWTAFALTDFVGNISSMSNSFSSVLSSSPSSSSGFSGGGGFAGGGGGGGGSSAG